MPDQHASPPDEVALIRTMFKGIGPLSRNTFSLGDTLGTGTFGRVRIVTYHPSSAAASTVAAATAASAAASSTPMPSPSPSPTGNAGAPVTAVAATRAPDKSAAALAAAVSSGAPLYFALKMLKKSEIIRLKQVEHIKAEKAILSRISHPFIVNLFATFQDERHLHMTIEYVLGGELFSQLRKVGRFSNDTARFYAGEIVLALQYLHAQEIVYRDLKPENLLIDKEGHIKVRWHIH